MSDLRLLSRDWRRLQSAAAFTLACERVGGSPRKGLFRRRRIDSWTRWKNRAAHNIEVGTSCVVRSALTTEFVASSPIRRPPRSCELPTPVRVGPVQFFHAHLLQKIDALGAHILDHRQFVPVLLERYAYHREAEAAAITRDRIKVEKIGFIHQTFGLRLDRKVTVPILDQMLFVAPSPTRHVRGNVSLATEIG